MSYTTNIALSAALLTSTIVSAQQTPQSQPQATQKIETSCDSKVQAEVQKRAEKGFRRFLGGMLNKANNEVQQKTGGMAPTLSPEDLAKQVHKGCSAPAPVTPPQTSKP